MDAYKAVVDLTNPDDGLLTTVQRFIDANEVKDAYEILRRRAGEAADCEERWSKSTRTGMELLPRLGFGACATAFEAFAHDAVKRCFETVFPTMAVDKDDEQYWKAEFDIWLERRKKESEVWNTKEHESETSFWKDVIRDLKTAPNQNSILFELKTHWHTVFHFLRTNSTSQQAVGLMQEMVDSKKQSVLGFLKLPTMENLHKTFAKLASEAPHNNGKRKFREMLSAKTSKKQKTKRTSRASSPSSMTTSSSASNISSDLSAGSSLHESMSSPNLSTPLPMVTSTPVRTAESASTKQRVDEITLHAIEHLITHYARKCSWQIWLRRSPHDVNCADAKTLAHLSNLFYGMRCLFSHGTPQKTVDYGVLRVDRIPQEASDLNIDIFDNRRNKAEEERSQEKELCQEYLLDVAKNAKDNVGQMKVDHDLFLTAQSFYAYVVQVIGGVAECVAYKYSDVNLRTKTVGPEKDDIQTAIDDAWKSAETKVAASSPISQTSHLSSMYGTPGESQTDDPSIADTQVTTSAGPSTGITQEFSDVSVDP